MPEIDRFMQQWSQEWTPEPPVKCQGDVFRALWEASKCYYGSNHYGVRPNFERILGQMTSLASWLSPSPFGNPIVEAISGRSHVRGLEWLHDSSDEYTGRKLILSQQTFLLEKLAICIRDLSKPLDFRSRPIPDYASFFHKLRDHFHVGIYNLNYDTVALSAWPEAYCGFDSPGNFDAPGVNQRPTWDFIYHLHGSVHHCITEYPYRIRWKEDLNGQFRDRLEMAPDMAQDFRFLPLTTLIAGGYKLDQLLVDPYQTFYSALVRHAHEADALLLAGYGFGDLHVNRAIRSRFERPVDNARPPRVLILEKSPNNKLQTASRQSHDFWAYQMTHTLNTRFKITKAHLDRKLTVASFVENGEFETDISNQVAVWHGGFLEAIAAVDKINTWMSKTQ